MTDFQVQARQMIERQLRRRGVCDEAVLDAMASVPRHRFVPAQHRDEAYADRALPNAQGQTVSQPYIVGLMTELLEVRPADPSDGAQTPHRRPRVLEIGTGSGYQTAILVALGADVVTIERHEGLLGAARRTLEELQYADRVTFHVGDGTLGCPQEAPYDRILVTAAAPRTPAAYREQLIDGGRIVIPMGGRRSEQALYVVERDGGKWRQTRSIGCVFVRLIGEDGWPD